ncbi:MAG: ISAzo13-like element transposase-related protein [Clostridia bacterium]
MTVHDPTLLSDLLRLVNRATRGDPESALQETRKRLTHLTAALRDQGYRVSATTVMRRLRAEGYSLQAPRKTLEGLARHPDRDAQFQVHRGPGDRAPDSAPPGHLRGRQKAGAGGELPDRRAGVAAGRET